MKPKLRRCESAKELVKHVLIFTCSCGEKSAHLDGEAVFICPKCKFATRREDVN